MTDLIKNLQNSLLYDHPIQQFSVIETHCSWVILTGKYAYKIKKAVNYGFLDYSNLEQRKRCCEQELQRNQLLASKIYLKLVPIYGTTQQPSFVPADAPIEYAVQMLEFPQQQILSQLLQTKKLNFTMIEQLADMLVQFHQRTELVPTTSALGSAAHAQQQVMNNFTQIASQLTNDNDNAELVELATYTEHYYEKIKGFLDQRKANGFVRQCHGDVHLNNIVYLNNQTIIFDCIDFNDDFCWTDTMGDLGFLKMDLVAHQQTELSRQLLNRYLAVSGDYQALRVLPYFQAYRAMVRAKIAIFSNQFAQYKKYFLLAKSFLQPEKPRLFIMCGLSASGKSTMAKQLAIKYNAITISSDRERKRLLNLKPEQDCSAPVLKGIYHPEQTKKTYQRLLELTNLILEAGYSVVVDASFREQNYRQQFLQVAANRHITVNIIYCDSDFEILKDRLLHRQNHVVDLSEAHLDVLQMQSANFDSFSDSEKKYLIPIDTTQTTLLSHMHI